MGRLGVGRTAGSVAAPTARFARAHGPRGAAAPTPERLSAAVRLAHREGGLTRIELGPLSLADAGAFLGRAVDAAKTSSLYEASGGNPFYLQQLARTMDLTPATGTGTVELSQAIEVPSAVAAALAEELALLSGPARLVLEGGGGGG